MPKQPFMPTTEELKVPWLNNFTDKLQDTAKGYAAARKQDGWLKSAVFGKSFRLVRGTDATGNPEFTLEVK